MAAFCRMSKILFHFVFLVINDARLDSADENREISNEELIQIIII